jgi:O-succinylbenzoate synthase
VDANGAWDVDTAVAQIPLLDKAAGGLEYVEQPCRTVDELAAVRRRVDVRIAADESIRRAEDPLRVALAGAADIAVLKCAPLGGVRRALQVAEAAGLPCVVSSALETSVGLAAELALAAALPELDFACGLDTLSLLEGDVVAASDALRPVDGYLQVRSLPLAPDPALLDRFAADPTQTAWWHERLARTQQRAVT